MTPERFQQIERLVSLAQERQPPERASFLEEACAGDDELRQRVEAMLQAHQHLAAFLVEAPPALLAEALQAQANDISETKIHRQLIGETSAHAPLVLNDRYIVERELGRGGMGQVLVARDTKLNRKVAIKFLVAGMDDEQALRRFEQEARAAGSLNHPNVLVIHDIGVHDGRPFIISELLEGNTLHERISGTPLPMSEAIDYALQLAEGLVAAHEKGIVHRDLKPENLFITKEGRLKILDFGIAKLNASQTLSARRGQGLQTETGTVLGTIGYMSPEQVRGQPADARSDLFSAGVILYEMFSGKRAFQEATPIETAYAILNAEPPELTAQVGLPIKEIVQRCLKKAPEERFQSALEMAEQLRSMVKETRSPGARARWRWSASALAALLVLAALLAGLRLRGHLLGRPGASQIQSIAVLPLENLSHDSEQEYFADGMTDAVITNLGKISALRVISRTSVMRYKGTKRPLEEIARELQIDAVVEGTVARSGDRVRITAKLVQAAPEKHLWAESYERRLRDVLVLQGELARAIASEIQVRLTPQEEARLVMARAIDPEAHNAYLKGRFYADRRNVEAFKKGLEYFKQAVQIDPGYALAYVGIASSYGLLAYYGGLPPNEAIPREREAALKALELNPSLAEAHVQLGFLQFQERNHSAAESEFKRAIELSPNSSDAHHGYSLLLTALGRYDEALKENRRKRELDPLWPGSFATAAHICYHARRYDQGIELARESLQLHPNFPPGHTVLGLIYEQQGRYAEAMEELRSAQKVDPSSPFALAMLGHLYAVAGRTQDAERVLQQLQQNSQIGYTSAYAIAAIYAGLRRKNQALAWLNKALADNDPLLQTLRDDPRFDDLRADTRVAELLRRIGLPP